MNDADRSDEFTERVPDRHPAQARWSRNAQRIASVLWPSFMAAAIAGLFFFSLFDAASLGLAMLPERETSALAAYGICFFFFWFVAALSSGMTMYLRRTRRRRNQNNSDNGPDS